MKKKSKGFTLIELLAVIVILAIIALIATPIILNMIKSAKENAFIDSAYGILDSAEKFVVERTINGEDSRNYIFYFEDGKQISNYNNNLKFKGQVPDYGNVVISSSNKIKLALWSESLNKCVYKDYKDNKVKINKDVVNKEDCEVQSDIVKATWFWVNSSLDYEISYVTDKEKRERVLNHLESIGINTIYLLIKNGIDLDELINTYGEFIKFANEKNIKIYLLDGDPSSILPSKYKITVDDRMDLVYDYNQKMKQEGINAKVEGINYDIEFNGGGDFGLGGASEGQSEESKRSPRRLAFINFAKYAKKYAAKKHLEVQYDIGHELTKYTYYDENNVEKNMGEELLKNSDKVNVMYYVTKKRSITTGNELTLTGKFNLDYKGEIDVKTSTIEYLNKYHKKYTVATELSFFRKDIRKVEACTPTRPDFVDELVPTYIDKELIETKSLPQYLKQYYRLQLLELYKYQSNKNLSSEIGISFHDVWELLELTGFETTQVITNRKNNFENDLRDTFKCL